MLTGAPTHHLHMGIINMDFASLYSFDNNKMPFQSCVNMPCKIWQKLKVCVSSHELYYKQPNSMSLWKINHNKRDLQQLNKCNILFKHSAVQDLRQVKASWDWHEKDMAEVITLIWIATTTLINEFLVPSIVPYEVRENTSVDTSDRNKVRVCSSSLKSRPKGSSVSWINPLLLFWTLCSIEHFPSMFFSVNVVYCTQKNLLNF